MGKRIGGSQRKSRGMLTKHKRDKGKISITSYLQSFNAGDKVVLKVEPAIQKGKYHHRFHGKVAVIKSQRGACYEVTFSDQNKEKIVIVHPVHLKRL